jgi:membrane-bound ClpP family serine protease
MNRRRFLETSGWLLFTLGSAVFLAESIISGNPIGIIGSSAFLIGCIFFLISERF